jgi:hypothetical protein
MVSLLVEQIKALQSSSSSSSGAANTSSSTDEEHGSSRLDVLGQSCGAAASCGGSAAGVKTGQSAARLRRCLSFEVQMAFCVVSCYCCCMLCLHGGAGCAFLACCSSHCASLLDISHIDVLCLSSLQCICSHCGASCYCCCMLCLHGGAGGAFVAYCSSTCASMPCIIPSVC